eukprot:10381164-Alexandrium_andersonii.AAC.1
MVPAAPPFLRAPPPRHRQRQWDLMAPMVQLPAESRQTMRRRRWRRTPSRATLIRALIRAATTLSPGPSGAGAVGPTTG